MIPHYDLPIKEVPTRFLPIPSCVLFLFAEGLLLGVDADPEAQVMMVEQFIAEAAGTLGT